MCRTIKEFLSFTVKLLVVVFIFAWLEEILNRLINFIVRIWKTRGHDPRELKAENMEKYYMKHGVQCSSCLYWIPEGLDTCPVCGNK